MERQGEALEALKAQVRHLIDIEERLGLESFLYFSYYLICKCLFPHHSWNAWIT